MLTIIVLIPFLIGYLVLAIILPLIAFLTAGNGFDGIAGAFGPGSWERATAYLFQGSYWDRWFVIGAIGLFVLLWIISFLVLIYKHQVAKAFLSLVGLAIGLVVAYIYIAWQNHEDFALWQRILIYIQLGSTALAPVPNFFQPSK